jgi:hypothetical protein
VVEPLAAALDHQRLDPVTSELGGGDKPGRTRVPTRSTSRAAWDVKP